MHSFTQAYNEYLLYAALWPRHQITNRLMIIQQSEDKMVTLDSSGSWRMSHNDEVKNSLRVCLINVLEALPDESGISTSHLPHVTIFRSFLIYRLESLWRWSDFPLTSKSLCLSDVQQLPGSSVTFIACRTVPVGFQIPWKSRES